MDDKKKKEEEGFASKAAKGIYARIEKAVPKVEKLVKEEIPRVEHAIERGAGKLEKGAETVGKAVGKRYEEFVEAEARRPKVIKMPDIPMETVGDASGFLIQLFNARHPKEFVSEDYYNIKKMIKTMFGKDMSEESIKKAHRYFWTYVKGEKLQEVI